MQERLPAADAIIALGGGVDIHGRPTSSTLHRIHTAISLYRQRQAPHLVFSGRWSSHLRQAPPLTEAESMRRHALEHNVPHEDIILENNAVNTAGNAYYCKVDIIGPRDYHKIILVTSPAHMERSRLMFEWVLGKQCEIDSACTDESRIGQDSEKAGYLALQSALRHITPGDHEAIGQVLMELQLQPITA
jgi:uncharacterized SAM-binding protein YcdF (DUF218 family)